MFGLDPTRLGVLRPVVLAGACTGVQQGKSRQDSIQGKHLKGTLSSIVTATGFKHVEKSRPDTRDHIYINPIFRLLVVTFTGRKKRDAEKHGSGKKQGGGKTSVPRCTQ